MQRRCVMIAPSLPKGAAGLVRPPCFCCAQIARARVPALPLSHKRLGPTAGDVRGLAAPGRNVRILATVVARLGEVAAASGELFA
eukprot:5639977-Pyramimonas_sp.AAC.1